MSAHFAEPLSASERVQAPHYLRAHLQREGLLTGAARPGEGSGAAAFEALSPLEALPWLAPAGSGPVAMPAGRSPAAQQRIGMMLHVGLAAALTLLGGTAWYAAGDPAAPVALAMHGAETPQAVLPAAPPPAPRMAAADPAATLAATPPIVPAAAAQTGREAEAARSKPASGAQASARTSPSLTRIAPTPAAAPEATAASIIAPPPPPVADSPVTSATLRQYRAAMDECRDAIRAITRLGDRQRPGRDASPAELASYRLRQQNAEAAKTYRTYIDTLARTARGTNSETLTRQSLDRARQTLGYLETMLADSKAALR
jgi:hypothetical protein